MILLFVSAYTVRLISLPNRGPQLLRCQANLASVFIEKSRSVPSITGLDDAVTAHMCSLVLILYHLHP